MCGWVRLKCRLCRCRCECKICRCKINNLMKDKTAAFILFILPGSLSLLAPLALLIHFSSDPFALPTPIRLLHLLGPFTFLCSGLRFPETALVLPRDCRLLWCFPEIAGCLGASRDYRLPCCFPEIAGCLVSCFRRMSIRLGCNLIFEY